MWSHGNIKMAIEAIRASRWRSLLTMLGIVIGIVSVVTTVSLGEGVKQGVVGHVQQVGADLVTVRPGKSIQHGDQGRISMVQLFGLPNTGSLSQGDFNVIQDVPSVNRAVPFIYVTSTVSTNERRYEDSVVIGTTEHLPDVLGQELEFGSFFGRNDSDRNVAVIGRYVAEQLFGENVPIGKIFTIRGQEFVVRGIFEEFDQSLIAQTADYNRAVFIPFHVAEELTERQGQIYQVLVRPSSPQNTDQAREDITSVLTQKHAGNKDFTVLTQDDVMATANATVDTLTRFVTAIAAISLVVGGIGILNIMLVSVTERTHEIGIRKAVGATNQQILGQFLTEAVILSLAGGLLGVTMSLIVNYLLRIFTNLTPVLTLPIIGVAVCVSIIVGVVFGVTPALKAARKHPIDALR